MLNEGRVPLSEAENEAVDALISKNEGEPVSLTRRGPGETGPLLAHVGDASYEIDDTGKTTAVS